MSFRELVHDATFIFNDTNYYVWKIRMLKLFRNLGPNIELIVYMGFPPPKDPQKLSLEDEENSYLNTLITNVFIYVLRDVVLESIMPFRNAREIWTKLQDKYDVSNIIEDDCSPSTSGRNELRTFSTSPTCGQPQGNEMVSSDGYCNDDSVLIFDDPSSLSYCNVSSLDLNTTSTKIVLHACVDSPCISCGKCLSRPHDDMPAISCCHDKNASISSSLCMANNVEKTEHPMEQDMELNGASSDISSSSSITHFCFMAKATKVSPTSKPTVALDDSDDVDVEDEDVSEASIREMGKMVFHTLRKNHNACSNFMKIMTIAIESKKLIEEYEDTIEKKEGHERE